MHDDQMNLHTHHVLCKYECMYVYIHLYNQIHMINYVYIHILETIKSNDK